MVIGLTLKQLVETFLERLECRSEELKGEIQAMKAGESPTKLKAFSKLLAENPNLPPEMMPFLMAFADTIVANNIVLSKVIPYTGT